MNEGTIIMSKQIQDAYIVAATRTPIGRSGRGYFRNTRPAISTDLFFGGKRLGDTDASDLFGFCFGQCADLLRLLNGALIFSLTLVGLDVDVQLRFR